VGSGYGIWILEVWKTDTCRMALEDGDMNVEWGLDTGYEYGIWDMGYGIMRIWIVSVWFRDGFLRVGGKWIWDIFRMGGDGMEWIWNGDKGI
jgi:hypothetical protein